jgi:hypothetical protein
MSELRIMGSQGDLKVTWSVDDPNEVEMARKQFSELRAKGFLAFRVDKQEDKGEQITEFDPAAEKIILAPQIRGGI